MCLLAGSYGEIKGALDACLTKLGPQVREKAFGVNAQAGVSVGLSASARSSSFSLVGEGGAKRRGNARVILASHRFNRRMDLRGEIPLTRLAALRRSTLSQQGGQEEDLTPPQAPDPEIPSRS